MHTDPTLDHSYAGEAPAGADEMLRLGREVLHSAQETAPQTQEIVVITNEADTQVDNGDIEGLVADWRSNGADVTMTSFPADLDLPHDVVDRQPATGQTDSASEYALSDREHLPVLLDAIR
ncbi:MAG: hypothetical protein WBL35_15975 [Ornithinibacter sp.]